jgi:YVTN family beta-propeller protein
MTTLQNGATKPQQFTHRETDMRTKSTPLALAICASFASTLAMADPTAMVTLGNNTAGISADPVLRKVFVTNYDDATVSAVDVDTLAVETYPAGANPRRIVANAATHRVYMVNDTSPGTMTVIDETNGQIVATIPLGDRPRGIASDFQRGEVYAFNLNSNSLSIVDAGTNAVVATIGIAVAPTGLDVNTLLGRIYVVSSSDGSVTIVDQATRAVIRKVAVGRTPSDATVDERTGKVYINNVADRTVSVIDPTTNQVSATIPVGAGSTFGAVSAVYGRYYLPNATSETLSIIDTNDDRLIKNLGVGQSPQQVQIDSTGGDIYVINQASNSVSVADARTETNIGTLAAGGQPWRIALGMNRLFALNTNGSGVDTMSVNTDINTQAGTAIATEYYDAADKTYFHSSNGIETRMIADGLYGETWKRTMEFFRVWTTPAEGRAPVCRFLGAPSFTKTTHVYTPYSVECDSLKSENAWEFEGVSYYVQMPDANGGCGGGTEPLYRLYNNGEGGTPNHRYTAHRATRDAMASAGWTAEGSGPDTVFACTPPLDGSAPEVGGNKTGEKSD